MKRYSFVRLTRSSLAPTVAFDRPQKNRLQITYHVHCLLHKYVNCKTNIIFEAMTTHTTVTRIGPLTIQRINSSQNSLAAGDVDDQPICDDGSILLSACQSFFGKEDHDPPPLQGNTDTNNNNDGVEAVGSPSQQDHSNKQQLSTALPNITLPECSSSNSLFQNNSRVLHSRARSMSPSLTTNTAAATDDLDLFYNCSPTYYNGGSEESDTTVMSNNWSTSYFETSDFNAQTWVDLVQETETIRYCGAGE